MKLYKSWVLRATYTIILVVATYATATQAATEHKQAEVNLQQVAVSAARPLKYGDKTTKKIPNQETLLLSTSPTTDKSRQHVHRNRTRSRIDQIEFIKNVDKTAAKTQVEVASRKIQMHGHETPIVDRNREIFHTSITNHPTTAISNRSRSTHTRTRHLEMPQHYNSYRQSEENVSNIQATTKATTTHKSHQRKPTTATHLLGSTNNNQTNANNRSDQSTSKNTTVIVRHYHSNQRNNNNNSNNSSTNAIAGNTSIRPKTESRSRNKPTHNNIPDSRTAGSVRSVAPKDKSNVSPTTITIVSTTSSPSTTTRPQFQLPNSFNIFAPEFWQFLNPTSGPLSGVQATTPSTTTRKPPKKYKPPTHISTKKEKLNLVKPKPTTVSRAAATKGTQLHYDTNSSNTSYSNNSSNNNNNNNISKKEEGPFRIALPTFNILSSKRETHGEVEKDKRNADKQSHLRERFDCPRESEVRFQLFPKICKVDEDCKVWNREEICCDIFGAKSCVSGIPKPLEETSHARVIPRKCPSRPLAELWWEVKECDNDMDCWPRVCCPDGRKRYCRTSQPELNTVPVPVQRSFNYLTEYLECTPPPPPIFDLHPKPCTSTLDCFPNVCCQEAGLRHCRPPKKSVLTI